MCNELTILIRIRPTFYQQAVNAGRYYLNAACSYASSYFKPCDEDQRDQTLSNSLSKNYKGLKNFITLDLHPKNFEFYEEQYFRGWLNYYYYRKKLDPYTRIRILVLGHGAPDKSKMHSDVGGAIDCQLVANCIYHCYKTFRNKAVQETVIEVVSCSAASGQSDSIHEKVCKMLQSKKDFYGSVRSSLFVYTLDDQANHGAVVSLSDDDGVTVTQYTLCCPILQTTSIQGAQCNHTYMERDNHSYKSFGVQQNGLTHWREINTVFSILKSVYTSVYDLELTEDTKDEVKYIYDVFIEIVKAFELLFEQRPSHMLNEASASRKLAYASHLIEQGISKKQISLNLEVLKESNLLIYMLMSRLLLKDKKYHQRISKYHEYDTDFKDVLISVLENISASSKLLGQHRIYDICRRHYLSVKSQMV
ncbi:hypothetical protein [Cysteiniphilum sp. QT6929]|uniref:hypothetical protein n=1 Tax=Cysteiniphilum sp. QT6929 TaxID=2975055 RepID=UPI0024B3A39F|nr:hypothetical protein [Cysteiniphilum sp. QT6929]WHN66580.1 hypothetical protein NYP54_04945 [Cysteiniphilum sp. QT6929]